MQAFNSLSLNSTAKTVLEDVAGLSKKGSLYASAYSPAGTSNSLDSNSFQSLLNNSFSENSNYNSAGSYHKTEYQSASRTENTGYNDNRQTSSYEPLNMHENPPKNDSNSNNLQTETEKQNNQKENNKKNIPDSTQAGEANQNQKKSATDVNNENNSEKVAQKNTTIENSDKKKPENTGSAEKSAAKEKSPEVTVVAAKNAEAAAKKQDNQSLNPAQNIAAKDSKRETAKTRENNNPDNSKVNTDIKNKVKNVKSGDHNIDKQAVTQKTDNSDNKPELSTANSKKAAANLEQPAKEAIKVKKQAAPKEFNELARVMQNMNEKKGVTENSGITDHENKLKNGLKGTRHSKGENVDIKQAKTTESNTVYHKQQQAAGIFVSRETNTANNDINNLHKSVFKTSEFTQKIQEKASSNNQSSTDNNSFMNQQSNIKTFATILNARNELTSEVKQQLHQQFESLMKRAKVLIKDRENATLTANLYPKELGKISLKLALVDGALHARFTVENDHVQKELNARFESLAQQMKESGVDIGGFEVDVQSGATSDTEDRADNNHITYNTKNDDHQSNIDTFYRNAYAEGTYA